MAGQKASFQSAMLGITYKRAFHESIFLIRNLWYFSWMSEVPIPTQPSPRSSSQRRTIEERLKRAQEAAEKATQKLARKKVQVQKYEAAQRARERKLDTRRKIIAGALALEHMRHDKLWSAVFRGLLDEYVTDNQGRALFGLAPLPRAETDVGKP